MAFTVRKVFGYTYLPKVSGGEGKKKKKDQVQVFNEILVWGLVGQNTLNNKPCTSRNLFLNLF